MSGGSRRSTSRSNQNRTNTLNPWSQQQFTSQMGRINEDLDGRDFTSYDQPLVAGLSGREQNARGLFDANIGSYQPSFDEASSEIRNTGYQSDFGDVSERYMNPYQRDVVDTSVNEINRYNDERNAQSKERALANKAYGGSGYAVSEAINNEDAMRQVASTTANLNYRGYNDARGYYGQDLDDRVSRAGMIAQLGERGHQLGTQDALTQNQLGETERGIEQDRNGANYNEFLRGEEDFYRRIGVRQQNLAMTPMLQNSNSTGSSSTTERSNPGLMGVLGSAASIGSMFVPGGQIAGLGGLFSSAMSKKPSGPIGPGGHTGPNIPYMGG